MPNLSTAAGSQPRVDRLRAPASEAESTVTSKRAEAAGFLVSSYLRDRALGEDLDAFAEIVRILQQMENMIDPASAKLGAVLARLETV